MSSAEDYVLPRPGIPKTLGILNIIFSVILILLGICGLGTLVLAPYLMQLAETAQKTQQAKAEARTKEMEKGFDDRIATAKTDAEKQAIEREKASAITNQPQITMDFSAAEAAMNDSKVMAINVLGALSGLVCHVLLLISGIGLVRLATWGRSLAVFWAGLQIVQIILLLVASVLIALPANKPINDQQIANLEKAAQGKPPGSPEVFTLKLTKTIVSLSVPLAVGFSLLGTIYPVVVLILLNKKGARAALLAGQHEIPGEM
jgi:hypothetical protein